MYARKRIIVALDNMTLDRARNVIRSLAASKSVSMCKVGLEQTTKGAHGTLIEFASHLGLPSFLDMKFCDIPNTVAAAAKEAAELGVHFFNVHASAGVKAMAAAVANKGTAQVLAVTLLTSLGHEECELIFGDDPVTTVTKFAHMAKAAGVDGLICSPQEIALLRRAPDFKDMLLVVPGVRLAGTEGKDDQARVGTPGKAIVAGADYIVVGRPITAYSVEKGGPVEGARLIVADIEQALAEKAGVVS